MGHRPVAFRRRALNFLATLCCAAALPAAAAEYVVLVQDKPSGHLKVDTAADGQLKVDYSYRDNGRGPDLRETVRLDARGLPRAYQGDGKTDFGGLVDETFTQADGRVRWKSHADEGDEPAGDDLVFLPLEPTMAYEAAVARFLLSQPEGRAPTIRGLKLHAERVLRESLPGPDGRPVPLVLVSITGGDPFPQFMWLRDDAGLALFGYGWPGFAVVEKGFEPMAPALVERVMKASDERIFALGRRLARPMPGTTLIRAVRWFDAPAAVMRGPSDVWLFGGRIGAVTAPGALKAKADRTIDGAGRTLLPGLWDSHGHMWAGDCLPNLAAGVTGVRDPANQNDFILRLRDRVERGELKCPTLVPMGFIEGESKFSARNGFVVSTLEAALEAVDWYAARGFRSLKLYNSIKPEWVKPVAAHAHALGLRVAGHVPAFMLAEQAIRDGYDEITHVNQAMLNFVTRPGDDPRTLMRFERIGSDALHVSMASPEARRFLRLVHDKGTWFDPTAVAFEAMFTQAQGQPNPSLVAVKDHLPVLWQRGLGAAEMDLSGPRLATFRQSYRRLLELVGAMHKAGATLVAGTDSSAGVGLHRELELYVQAGIPPLRALQAATWNGARAAGEDATRGRIARGMAADLLLVEGDPSRRISDIRRGVLVIHGGEAFRPSELYEALGFKPFEPGATWQD